MKKILKILIFTAFFALNSQICATTKLDSENFQNLSLQDPQPQYLIQSSKVLFVGTLAGAVFLYTLPESFTQWDKNEIRHLGVNWRRKVTNAPVADRDNFFLNWVTHPYWGAVYYMQPRSAGYGWFESALFAFVASSVFWEFGVEAFAEVPSWQDLIVTPAFGSLFGEIFWRFSTHIRNDGNRLFGSKILGKTALILMDPIGALIESIKGKKPPGYHAAITPISYNSALNGAQMRIYVNF